MGVFPQISRLSHTAKAVVLLGANLNRPEQQIRQAIQMLSTSCGQIVRCSSMYRSSPWGIVEQDYFLNRAVLIRTPWPPLALLKRLQQIEQQMGRIREIRMGPRVIDLDILVYGNRIIKHPTLQVPHRFLPERRFALIPLMEVWSGWKHPELGGSAAQLLSICEDQGKVIRL